MHYSTWLILCLQISLTTHTFCKWFPPKWRTYLYFSCFFCRHFPVTVVGIEGFFKDSLPPPWIWKFSGMFLEFFCELFPVDFSSYVPFLYIEVCLYNTYYLYYLLPSCNLDFCAEYYYYYSALTQILFSLFNTNVSGGTHHFPPPGATQEPMAPLPTCFLLLYLPSSLPNLAWRVLII